MGKLARVKPGEPRRDGVRGNYVSVVSVSVSGRGRALIALCIKDYVAASLLLLEGNQDSFNVRAHLSLVLRLKRQDGPLNEPHSPFVCVIHF